MTLDEIWKRRDNLCLVAFRKGTILYVSLAHKRSDTAFEAARTKQGMTLVDRDATDWVVGEIAGVDAKGVPTKIEER